jgi:hypothetical protein
MEIPVHSSMDFAVYDGAHRRASLLVVVALIAGMLAAFATFFVIRHGETTVPPPGSYLILFPLTMILALFPLIIAVTNVRIRVESVTGEIFRLFTLFGHEVRRQRLKLSDFDRVSLNRSYRAGYRVSLVGREREVMVFVTNNLGTARERADEIAAECGLKVSDHL